jgi:trehalose 6-phosphate phosphatase
MAGIAVFSDADLTLVKSFTRTLPQDRQDTAWRLHEKLGGAFAVVTGRSSPGVDCLIDGIPASVEFHSAWRPARGGPFVDIVPQIDSERIGAAIESALSSHVPILANYQPILAGEDGLFVQKKPHTLALLFNSASATAQQRDLMTRVTQEALEQAGVANDYHFFHGADVIEVAPKGRKKSDAVRDFMNTPAFAGRVPVFIGDGGADALAMEICAKDYGGFGIAVGRHIPDAPCILARVDTIEQAWECLRLIESLPDDFAAVKAAFMNYRPTPS